jgi:GGDEF domain-containing protein
MLLVSTNRSSRVNEARLQKYSEGSRVAITVTHAGRLSAWILRDALLRDADLEPMGLRSKAAWERDLFLRLRFATDDEPLAIIFLDLDNFGTVNKELGATVGDDVLRATFDLTKNLVGARGYVYRFGGEEVGVLLPSTSLDAACELAEQLRTTIESAVQTRVPALGRADRRQLRRRDLHDLR